VLLHLSARDGRRFIFSSQTAVRYPTRDSRIQPCSFPPPSRSYHWTFERLLSADSRQRPTIWNCITSNPARRPLVIGVFQGVRPRPCSSNPCTIPRISSWAVSASLSLSQLPLVLSAITINLHLYPQFWLAATWVKSTVHCYRHSFSLTDSLAIFFSSLEVIIAGTSEMEDESILMPISIQRQAWT